MALLQQAESDKRAGNSGDWAPCRFLYVLLHRVSPLAGSDRVTSACVCKLGSSRQAETNSIYIRLKTRRGNKGKFYVPCCTVTLLEDSFLADGILQNCNVYAM